jgi:hypothetical protein
MSVNPSSNPYTLDASRAATLPQAVAPSEIPSRLLDCEAQGTLFAKGSGAGPINVTVPWYCELIDMSVHSQGAHASGTCQAKHGVGGTAITDAVIAAVANTVIHAATIDPAQSKFVPGEILSLAFTNTPDVRVALVFKRYQTVGQTNPDGT